MHEELDKGIRKGDLSDLQPFMRLQFDWDTSLIVCSMRIFYTPFRFRYHPTDEDKNKKGRMPQILGGASPIHMFRQVGNGC
ncbi:hypothetical protein CEXT_519621 [Caerostris extrusa]|uniref:Ycf15 n=1 Tax=Caerostris extrusa TaxID=172846 RepID=A0AAV4TL35_CAEEX|nr:hypothetical protein CEXT_519621 [Caerostris extrusa]